MFLVVGGGRGSTGPTKGTNGPGNLRVRPDARHQSHHHWKLLSPARRRAAVHHLIQVMRVSERFACRVTGQHRTTQRHQATATTPADRLDRLAEGRGYPKVLRCDNGPELACTAMADWTG